jgi:hypothetical protein
VQPILVAVSSREWVCGRYLPGIIPRGVGGAWLSVSYECCVWSGRGLCFWPITSPEESCRLFVYVLLSVIRCNNLLHLKWVGRKGQSKKERTKERKKIIHKGKRHKIQQSRSYLQLYLLSTFTAVHYRKLHPNGDRHTSTFFVQLFLN